VSTRISLVLSALVLAACSGASPAPKGWTLAAGSNNTWVRGGGAGRQQYSYVREAYSGSLTDLASQVTVDVLTRYSGAKLQGSVPFEPCPGLAGVARFSLRGATRLEVGFAVHDAAAVRTAYLRPAATQPDPNVTAAMQYVLC
jgi:hypothetical protein